MKRLLVLTLIFTIFSVECFAQTNANDILGKWLSESGKAKIEVFESGNKYYGKIIWLKNPLDKQGKPKMDDHNPDPKEREHHLLGLLLLKSLEYDGKGTWQNGTIYDPVNGKNYRCRITKDAKGNLDIRGYIGVSMIGRTTVWVRVE
jgi:uncharacterized protein (DUF2147 family)